MLRNEQLEFRNMLAAGMLDPSFGDAGLVTTDIGWPTSNRSEDAVAYQSDGKFIVATNARDQFIAVRYDADGAIDTSFGDEGVARVDFAGTASTQSVAVDAFDNVILAGYVRAGADADFGVVRLAPDGDLDTSFDGDGIAVVDFGGNDVAVSVVVDAGGRIVVGGATSNTSGIGNDFAIARLNANGSLDLTFDGDGKQTVDIAGLHEDMWKLETDYLDRPVMVGRTTQLHSGGGSDIAVVRLTEAGSLDSDFSGDGIVRWDLGSNDAGFDLATYETGTDARIVVTGTTNGRGATDRVVMRLDDAGNFDSTFNGTGIQFVDVRGHDFLASVAIDANFQILVAGHTSFPGGTSYDWVVTRLNTSGQIDTTFGIDGTQRIEFGAEWESSPYLTMDPAGKILVSGHLRNSEDIGLARLNPDGSLDLTFGTDGTVQTDVRREGTFDEARDIVAHQADGRMVVLATLGEFNKDIGVLRYNVDGSLDQTFGTNGITRFGIGDSDYPQSVTIDSQGRIVIGGYSWFRYTQNTRDDFSIARLTPDGNLDTSFNGSGTWSMDFGTIVDRAYAVAVDSTDRVYLAGSAGLVRLTEAGMLDSTWGNSGVQPLAVGNARGLAFDSLGRILVAGSGYTSTPQSYDFAVERLTPAGQTDTTYGDGGVKLVDFGGSIDSLTALVLDDQDRAVLAGVIGSTAASQDFGVARLSEDGQIDTTFNSTGYQRIDFSGARDYAYSVAVDSQGRVVVGGMTDSQSETSFDFGVLRLSADGSLDTSFAAGGKQTIDFGNTYDAGDALMIDDTDRILIVGTSEQPGIRGSDIALARLLSNESPTVSAATWSIAENAPSATPVGTVNATDPDGDPLTYSILSGNELGAFTLNSTTGEFTVADASKLDYESDGLPKSFALDVQVQDGQGGADTATITINLLNQASVSGDVFVDTNENGLREANEPGIDGVTIELLDENGDAVLDAHGVAITAVTAEGGFYLFEDLDPGDYRLHEIQPSGVDDGADLLGSLGGTSVANDVMQLTLAREDAFDYAFAEIGQQVTAGDTASIGFWQNKHGQALIAEGGTGLADWLTTHFGNVFGGSLAGADGEDVAEFYREQLFKQTAKKSSGPAKVDAQFMAVALATYFTSRNLAGDVAAAYGFNVTDTGIGTKVVNVGASGAAFNMDDGANATILELLAATNAMTDEPDTILGFAHIYDRDGDGLIDSTEAALRAMANEIYFDINQSGGF